MNPVQPGPRRHSRQPSMDPLGKRALFETPVEAPDDHLRSGPSRAGKDALYSTGPPRTGTALVECGGCGVRSRIGLADVGLRLLTFSAWVPGRRHGHWMRCPACGQRTWCSIGWNQ